MSDPKNDTQYNVVLFSRVSTQGQDNNRQIFNLKSVAEKKGWNVKRVFTEKISGTIQKENRHEFQKMLTYVKDNNISIVMVSEVSRISRRVVDCVVALESLHSIGVGFYIEQFNMLSYEDGKENTMVKMLFQMLSIGAEMENNLRKERQRQGIQLKKLKNPVVYSGRKKGATSSPEKLKEKYSDVVDLLNNSSLSIRKIASITNRSINTVRKVKICL